MNSIICGPYMCVMVDQYEDLSVPTLLDDTLYLVHSNRI